MDNTKISKFLSRKISVLSAMLTLMVVFIHFTASCHLYVGECYSIFAHIQDYIGQGITRNAVPLFFFISGLLAFWYSDSPKKLMGGAKKRLRTLGIPYLIWNCIATVFFFALDYLNSGAVPTLSVGMVINCILNNQYNGPLWYVQKLLIYSIAAPLIFLVIKDRKRFIAIFVLTLFQQVFLYDYAPGLFFYIAGAGAAVHYKNLLNKKTESKIIVVFTLVFLALQICRINLFDPKVSIDVLRNTTICRLYEVFSPIMLWVVSDIVSFDKTKSTWIEKHTFSIYVTHYMVLSIVTSNTMSSLLHLPTNSFFIALLFLFGMPVSVYTITVLIFHWFSRKCPFVYGFIMGGR